jgi:uncharacterized membrane protein
MSIKPKKEYLHAFKLLSLSTFLMIIIYWFQMNSREEIVSLFVSSIIFYLANVIYNLLYFIPAKALLLRFILPGILSIITPLILWKNRDVEIYQYVIIGFINLMIGLIIYLKYRKPINNNAGS